MNNKTNGVKKIIPIIPHDGDAPPATEQAADEVLISLYAAHEKIYPRSVTGLFSNWRWAAVFLTQMVFYG